MPALRELLDVSIDEVHRLRDSGARLDHAPGGLLQVVQSDSGAEALRHEHDVMTRWGVRAELLTREQVAEREPGLLDGVAGGLLLCDDERVDPALLLEAVLAEAVAHGTRVARATVASVRSSAGGAVVDTDRGRVQAREVVLAAGVWTPVPGRLARHPVCRCWPAKGHSVTVVPPTHPAQRADAAARPAAGRDPAGVRPAHHRRLRAHRRRATAASTRARTADLVRRAGTAIALAPGTQPAHEWSGLRPATPDGLPAIGRLATAPAVVVATGHGMLGSSAGPGTGELVAEILEGRRTPDAFSPNRFHRPVTR